MPKCVRTYSEATGHDSGAQKANIWGSPGVLLVTVSHYKWLIATPKSLIMLMVVCGKRGTVVYYLHCNCCIYHNWWARHPSESQPDVFEMKIRPPVA